MTGYKDSIEPIDVITVRGWKQSYTDSLAYEISVLRSLDGFDNLNRGTVTSFREAQELLDDSIIASMAEGVSVNVDVTNYNIKDNFTIEVSGPTLKITLQLDFEIGSDALFNISFAGKYIDAISNMWEGEYSNSNGNINMDVKFDAIFNIVGPGEGDITLLNCGDDCAGGIQGRAVVGGTEIFIDENELDLSASRLQQVAGHEFGHIMGFRHESSDSSSLMNPTGTGTVGYDELMAIAEDYGL